MRRGPATDEVNAGKFSTALGLFFYIMLTWSYTVAVFTDPGSSTAQNSNGYAHLPSQESGSLTYTSFCLKRSTGDIRFCKKCQMKKPDRAHHCSSCGKCVLKMDHHCVWLATCLGLRNYKAFVLFLIYLTLFCGICFFTSAIWVWDEILNSGEYYDSFMPANYVVLAVLSGIIGLVISGFTMFHLWLIYKGRTTIENMEQTRYLSPLRNSIHPPMGSGRHYLAAPSDGRPGAIDQLREIHANSQPEPHSPAEGNGYSAPAYPSYEQQERMRNYNRYEDYMDERDNDELPNAFDLGWRRNFGDVFGPSPLLWAFPICNSVGDGWSWEASDEWLAAHQRILDKRQAEEARQRQRERAAGWGVDSPTEEEFQRTGTWQLNKFSPPTPRLPRPDTDAPRHHGEEVRYLTTATGVASTPPLAGRRSPSKADKILGRERGMYSDVQLQPMQRKKFDQYNYISEDEDDDYETSSDEERAEKRKQASSATLPQTKDWNDIPEDFLKGPPTRKTSKSPGNREQRKKKEAQDWDEWDQ